MPGLVVKLRDRNAELTAAWMRYFRGVEDMSISTGDIFGETADAIVSPANSFGFMDGGIDLAYSQRFGWELQLRLQEHLRAHFDGELPVGQAVVIETEDREIPYLISAPTMRIPMRVAETLNAYLAFRAALQAVRAYNIAHPGTIRSILSPGLATAVGEMPSERCARQMHAAYSNVVLGQTWNPSALGVSVEQHWQLVR